MYTTINFKTKKALKEAVAAGRQIAVFQPGPFGHSNEPINGNVCIEGPHYPEPHRFYASAVVKDSIIVKVK
jgi:hypothetical protein